MSKGSFSPTTSVGRPLPKTAASKQRCAISLAASRQYPFFGTAYDLNSGVSSRTGQVTIQLTGGGNSIGAASVTHFNLGYTFMRARDESNN